MKGMVKKMKFAKIKSAKKVNCEDKFVYCLDVKDTHNFNINNVNVGNCRLVSDVKNLGYFNSIGGTALEVGSIKVNTVNLVRIAYENDKENYLKALREKIILCCQTLDVIRHIIERNVEKGLLPNYDLKIINIKSQYNTIGVIGIYEACDKYGLIEVDEFGNHYYTEEGLLEIFANNTHEPCKPMHLNPPKLDNAVHRYTNCYKYDINSAYASAYITLFPKAHDDIMALYLGRHENPDNKKILNYFNGMLKRKGFAGTYYWVVNRTNEIMNKALNEVGGVPLYINTDGFIVQNPTKLIKHSTELGKFKLEYSGDVYIYVDKNYFIIQAGQELKGDCMCMVRDKFDLPNGKVVHYNKVRKVIKDATVNDSEVSILVADNIIEETVKVYGI